MLSRLGWTLGPGRTQLARILGARALSNGSSKDVAVTPTPSPPVAAADNNNRGLLFAKTGVTGPWMLGVGVASYVLSKELYVFNSETVMLVVMGGVVYWLMRKLGKPVAQYLDDRSDKILESFNEGRNAEEKALVDAIEAEKKVEGVLNLRHDVFEIVKERNSMKLEEEFRRRQQEVHREVKKRLDYQHEVEQTRGRLEHSRMVQWLEDQVLTSLTKRKDEHLNQCVADLKQLASATSSA